jgi:TonB family protein
VYVQFIVNENGDVEDPRVIRGIGGGADEAALEAVRDAKFKPGVQRGRPVRVQYSLPIVFRLGNSESHGIIGTEEPEIKGKPMSINLQRSGNTIQGTVTDGDTGEPLAGANIILEGTNTGTVSDRNGEFSISYQEGESSKLMVTYVGYGRVSADISSENLN